MDAILKIFFGYISASYCPTNAKFGTRKHNHMLTGVTYIRTANFKNSRWQMAIMAF